LLKRYTAIFLKRAKNSSPRGRNRFTFKRTGHGQKTFATPRMKSATRFSIVLVTAPDVKVARRLAQAALKARLIACANLIPRLESHYWWRGKIETSAEVLMLMKTTRTRLSDLEKLILARHPYDTPEIIVLSPTAGTPRYLKWLLDSVREK
jgi:periplasmic divalent cation tolerance protein